MERVPGTGPLTQSPLRGAGFELPAGAALSREAVQKRQAVAIKAAERLLLDVPGDHAPEQVLAQSGRGRAAELDPPAPPKRIERKRADGTISAASAAESNTGVRMAKHSDS